MFAWAGQSLKCSLLLKLFCSLNATFIFNFARSIYNRYPGDLGRPGLVNFGTFVSVSCTAAADAQVHVAEYM